MAWPTRLVLAASVVTVVGAWTPVGVDSPSRMIILLLIVLLVVGVTSRPGRAVLTRRAASEHAVPVLGGATSVLFLLLLLQVVLRGPLAGEDVGLSRATARVPHDWLYRGAQLVSAVGEFAVEAAFLLVVAGVLTWRRRHVRPLVVAAAALGLLGVVVVAGKLALGRARPPAAVHALYVGGSSFPSGHTTTAVVVGCAVAWLCSQGRPARIRQAAWTAAAAWALLVGVTRLYLDQHWLSDVLASWALGVVLVCALVLANRHWSLGAARIEAALRSLNRRP